MMACCILYASPLCFIKKAVDKSVEQRLRGTMFGCLPQFLGIHTLVLSRASKLGTNP
jgi:hypothetical protein